MKNNHKQFLLLLILSSCMFAQAANYVTLTINYSTVGTVDGYDHLTKMRVYIDGNEAGDNTPKKQTIPNAISVEVPKGSHKIKAVMLAKNESYWEERIKSNNYSLDWVFEKTINFTSDKTIDLVFDINQYKVIEKSSSSNLYTESSEFLNGTNSSSSYSTKSNNSSTNNSGNYQTALEKLNAFLKPMDADLKKWIEVKNGYIIEHFRGTYTSKAKISDIEGIEKDAKYNVVHLYCKNKSKCVYSDYMKSDYDYFNYNCSSASQMLTLYDLMTEFWYQLTGKKPPVDNSENKNLYTDYYLDNYKSNSNTTTSGDYQMSLNKLNDFLKTFAKGFYIKLEVIDGYIFTRFENGNYNKFKMQDMQDAIVDEPNNKVLFKCKNDKYCQTTNWKENSNYYSHFIDDNATYAQLVKLKGLINDFKKAYLESVKQTSSSNYSEKYTESSEFLNGSQSNMDIKNSGNSTNTKSSSSTSSNSSSTSDNKAKVEKALQELNDYMITLDNGRYKGMQVTNGYIIQNYDGGNTSKAKIEDIDRVEINVEYKYAKLACKGNSKCVYSSITNGYHDYFNFNVGDKSLTKMQTLLNNFLTALKKANSQNISSTTTANSSTVKTQAQKIREQKDKERQEKTNSNDDDDSDLDDIVPTLSEKTKKGLSNLTNLDEIPKGTKVQVTGLPNKNEPDYDSKKKYIGKIGTAFYDIIENHTGTYVAAIEFKGEKEVVSFFSVNLKIVKDESNKNNGNWIDEDSELTESQKSSFSNLTDKKNNIPKGTKVLITGYNGNEKDDPNKKKYIGQIGTAEFDIPEENIGTYNCGIRFDNESKFVTFYQVKLKVIDNSSSNQTSTSNYSEPLKKLNEYLKTFNKETYRDIEVKEGKVYFAFYVYGATYKSSISINELKNNTSITIGKSVGSFKTDEVKILCKGGSNCFYSTYSNSSADHFRFFSNTVKDFTKMEQLVKDFIKAL